MNQALSLLAQTCAQALGRQLPVDAVQSSLEVER